MYYVYILICRDGTYYTGYAADLEARVQKHNQGLASKYTRSRLPVRVAYYEVWPDRASAMSREWAIKKLTRQGKMQLMQGQTKPWELVNTMFLISACLVGENCRYNGGGFDYPRLRHLVTRGKAIAVCPEVLGGAPVPREPCEIKGGDGFDVLDGRAKVVNSDGEDKTAVFVQGAAQVLALARKHGARAAILKERSPSCGVNMIYDGTFGGIKVPGPGCTTAQLLRAGLQVYSEQSICLDGKNKK